MNDIKKGDLVEIRSDITSFMTLKMIGKVSKILDGKFTVKDDKGNVLGTFLEENLKKR